MHRMGVSSGPQKPTNPLTSASPDRQSLACPALWLLPAGHRAPEPYMAPEHLPNPCHSVTHPPTSCCMFGPGTTSLGSSKQLDKMKGAEIKQVGGGGDEELAERDPWG